MTATTIDCVERVLTFNFLPLDNRMLGYFQPQLSKQHSSTIALDRIHAGFTGWCLNAFRRTSIPEFRDRLLEVFPYRHILKMDFMNIVAGFDAERIHQRLLILSTLRNSSGEPCPQPGVAEPTKAALAQRLAERDAELAAARASLKETRRILHEVLHSRSWKLTASLRTIAHFITNRRYL